MQISIDGVNIRYDIYGDKGTRVLLLHGWGCDATHMKPVAEDLQRDHQVIAVDFPGHGGSDRPPEPWGVPEYADCLRKMLERLSFIPCSVVAHSFGCRVAAYLASLDDKLFSRIVFTGAAGIRPKQTEEGKRRNDEFQKKKAFWNKIKKFVLFRFFAEKAEEKLRKKYGSADYNALDEEMRKTFVRVINMDLSDCYRKIRQSTLLIWGDKDDATPLWMGQMMEKEIPDAGLVVFENATHFAYLEQIGRFNTIVSHFLTEE